MESKDQGVWPDGAAYCHVSLDLSASTSERPQRSGMTQAPGDLIKVGSCACCHLGKETGQTLGAPGASPLETKTHLTVPVSEKESRLSFLPSS